MAKRPRLTVEDVLQQCDDDSDFSDDDDKMNLLWKGVMMTWKSMKLKTATPTLLHHQPAQVLPLQVALLTCPSCDSTTWSSQVNLLKLQDFSSPVGPTVDISSSPMDVFGLFFTDDLLEEIVKETVMLGK